MSEIWKAIEGTGCEVSSLGRVKGVRGRVLKPQSIQTGYRYVRIQGKNMYVHRLVANAFLGEADGKEVDHIDGVQSNNVVSNLRWVTTSENIRHSYDSGHALPPGREVPVRMEAQGYSCTFVSICAAARAVGRHFSRVRDAISRGTTCAGARWYRAEGF